MSVQVDMWVIYDHPLDHPDVYVARRWLMGKSGPRSTDQVLMDEQLGVIQYDLLSRGLTKYEKHAEDDPKILEIWM